VKPFSNVKPVLLSVTKKVQLSTLFEATFLMFKYRKRNTDDAGGANMKGLLVYIKWL
jgi:hypothetical protein